MSLKKAILKSFDEQSYHAAVQVSGSQRAYLEDVNVAKNIAAQAMTAGRKVAILFFDEHNPREAVIIAVFD